MARHLARVLRALAFVLRARVAWTLSRIADAIDPPPYRVKR